MPDQQKRPAKRRPFLLMVAGAGYQQPR